MDSSDKIFIEAYNSFNDSTAKKPSSIRVSWHGDTLNKFSEFYFNYRLEHCGLKHFSSDEKSKYIIRGILLATAFFAVAIILIKI